MKKIFIIIFWLYVLTSCQASEPAQQIITKKEKEPIEVNQKEETYKTISNGAEGLILSYQDLLNDLLKPDITKEQRENLVHNSIFNTNSLQQIFNNPEVIIEDDIDEVYYIKNKVKDLRVERYLSDLSLFLEREENSRIEFDNIRTIKVKEGKETFVLVSFESIIRGSHALKQFNYKKTNRLATVKAVKTNGNWIYSIMSVGFYDIVPIG